VVIWITGISAAGKTTICDAIWAKIKPKLPHLTVLDGDVVRDVFGNDLGYKEESRVKQIQRIQSLAKMMSDQGLIVLVAALYSHPDLLRWNRENLTNYLEVYLDAPLDLVKSRDPKGLYAKVAAGEMKDVVGIDIPWHAPQSPDIKIDALTGESPDEVADKIIKSINDFPGMTKL